ncbi:non-muscle myosin heavy [Cystoisospora suis]|uniref:Non-muscle myosin heavy n=1 Tax=Cystoisospora suis TaxID=483139 RepID=A0A2C6LFA8_9APIC|nr:non-muscle myosin heavy [Cystoisospora suis]
MGLLDFHHLLASSQHLSSSVRQKGSIEKVQQGVSLERISRESITRAGDKSVREFRKVLRDYTSERNCPAPRSRSGCEQSPVIHEPGSGSDGVIHLPKEVVTSKQMKLPVSAIPPQREDTPLSGRANRKTSLTDDSKEPNPQADREGTTETHERSPTEVEDRGNPLLLSVAKTKCSELDFSLLEALQSAQNACEKTIHQLRRVQQDVLDAGEAASRLIADHSSRNIDLRTSSFSAFSDTCTSTRSAGKPHVVRQPHSSSSLSSSLSHDGQEKKKREGINFTSNDDKRNPSSRDSSPRSSSARKNRDKEDLLRDIPRGSVCWKQQKILLIAVQKQLDEVSSYASALYQLEQRIQATASSYASQGICDENLSAAVAAAAVQAAQALSSLPHRHAPGPLSDTRSTATIQEEEHEKDENKQFIELLEAECMAASALQSAGEESSSLSIKAKAKSTAASNALGDHLTLLAERLSEAQSTITKRATFVSRWGELFIEAAAEIEIHLDEVAPYVKKGMTWERQIDQKLHAQQKEIQALQERLQVTKKTADQVASRLKQKRQQFLLAIQDWTTEKSLHQLNKADRMRQLNTRIDALDRQIRGLAAFSPLFIVERTPKYVTLQYKPMGCTTDYEISIEGLELSLEAQEPHAYKISSFFSVRVTPQLTWLEERLERAIRNYFSTICTLQQPGLTSENSKKTGASLPNQGFAYEGNGYRERTAAEVDSGAAVGAQSRKTIYDYAPYSLTQQAEFGRRSRLSCSTSGTKRGRNTSLEEELEENDLRMPGSENGIDMLGPRRKTRCLSEREGQPRKKQVKIFTEHIAAIVLKTLTTAFGSTETD